MDFIPLMSPSILEQDIEAAARVLRSGMLVQGAEVLSLEKNIANYTGSREAMALSNGTATLHLALIALGIGPGDEVIVPAFSYIATANVVELVGATPVFVDTLLETSNIDVSKIEAAISTRTRTIMPVHEFGLACDISRIMEIAGKHKLHVIEDAACALGAREHGKAAGSFGAFGSFSLHPRKAISSGEGGLLITQDEKLASQVRILRNHGIEMQDGKMEFVQAGFNYRMTDFQAALVNSQMKRLDDIISYKQELAAVYFNELKNPNILLPQVPEGKNHTWQTFHIVWQEGINRDAIIQTLKEKGIGTNYGAQCMPAQKYFYQKYGLNSSVLFPNALQSFKQGLALPIYEKLNKEQISYIAKTINSI